MNKKSNSRVVLTARQIEQLMKAKYRVPDTWLKELRAAYADHAVRDSEEIKMNRIYSVAALALRRYTNSKKDPWGTKRLLEYLQTFSDLYERFVTSGDNWAHLMKELRDEAGIVIRTGEEGDELCEYDDDTLREMIDKEDKR